MALISELMRIKISFIFRRNQTVQGKPNFGRLTAHTIAQRILAMVKGTSGLPLIMHRSPAFIISVLRQFSTLGCADDV